MLLSLHFKFIYINLIFLFKNHCATITQTITISGTHEAENRLKLDYEKAAYSNIWSKKDKKCSLLLIKIIFDGLVCREPEVRIDWSQSLGWFTKNDC